MLTAKMLVKKTKYFLIKDRLPPRDFKFPPKQCKDKKRSTGVINRYCQLNLFTEFDFITYLFQQDGLYCIACVLFHTENQREQTCVLLTKPYRNWKDVV